MTVLNEQLSGGGVGGRVGGARERTTAGPGVESCAGGVAVRSRVLTDNAGNLDTSKFVNGSLLEKSRLQRKVIQEERAKIEKSSNFKRSRFETSTNEIKSRLERNIIVETNKQIKSCDVKTPKSWNTTAMRSRRNEETRSTPPSGQIFKRTPQSFMSTDEDMEWKRLLERRKKCKDGLKITQLQKEDKQIIPNQIQPETKIGIKTIPDLLMDKPSLPEPIKTSVSAYKQPECNFPIRTSIRKQLASPSLLPPTQSPSTSATPLEKELFVDSLESSTYRKSTSISTLVSVSLSQPTGCQDNCINSRAQSIYFYNCSNLETDGVNETQHSCTNKSFTNKNNFIEQRFEGKLEPICEVKKLDQIKSDISLNSDFDGSQLNMDSGKEREELKELTETKSNLQETLTSISKSNYGTSRFESTPSPQLKHKDTEEVTNSNINLKEMKDSILSIENKREESYNSKNNDYYKAKENQNENKIKEDKTENDDNIKNKSVNDLKTEESSPKISQLESQTSCNDSGYSSNISRNSTKDLDDCKTDAEMENLTEDSYNDDLDCNVSVTNRRMGSTSRCDSVLSKDSSSQSEKSSEGSKDSSSGTSSSGSEYEYESEYESEHDSDNQGGSSDSGVGLEDPLSKTKKLTKKLQSIFNKRYFKDEYENPYSSKQLPPFSDNELEIEVELRAWVEALNNPNSTIVKDLQSKYGMLLPPCTKAPPQEPNIKFVTGEKDKDGKYHGEIEIHYENGDYFWGDMEHGSKEGMASVVLFNGDNFMGRFKDNYLDGFVQEVITYCDRDNVTREVFYSRGVRHGFYRELGPNKQFWCAGRFCNGEKRGPQWRWGRGGSYNVGNVDIDNKPDGEDNVYLYPDLLTAMEGSYNQGKMKEGHLSVITDISKEYGIPVPVLARLPSDKVYSYEPSSSHVITKRPMLRDPYEQRYVYVKESYVPFAGEGLFAKQKIKAGQLCSIFNGVRERHLWGVKSENSVWSDYRISVDRDVDIDIRQEHVSLKNYKATLGHKTCHSFSPNAHFNQFWHPRFGLVMSIVAYRDISPGEEICVSYNYDIQKAPQWYRDLWFHHVRYEMNWSEQKVYSWAARSYKKTGLAVQVPPPERNSSRFIPCGVCDEHVGLDSCSVACQVCEAWHHISCTHIQIQDVMQEGNKYTWTCQKCA